MNVEDMTPEELRRAAARREAMEAYLAHIPEEDRPAPAPEPEPEPEGPRPWEREVEVGGVTYTVDMRRLKSREFLHMAMDAADGDARVADQLALFDYVFEPCEAQILAEVERRVGYEDFEVYYEICGEIMEAVEGKAS